MKLRWWKTAQEIEDAAVERFRKELAAEKEEKNKESWVEIKGEVAKEGLKMELDWNDEFIAYLRDNGIDGTDDEVVIQKWIAMLYQDLLQEGPKEHNEPSGYE